MGILCEPLYRLYWAPCALFGPSRLRAKVVASNACTPSSPTSLPFPHSPAPPLPLSLPFSAPGPGAARGRRGGGTTWPRPQSRLFLEQLQEALRRPPSSPTRVRTAPAPRSAPPPPRRSPSFGSAGARPPRRHPDPRLPAPGSRLSAPGFRSLWLGAWPLMPRALAVPQAPALLPARAPLSRCFTPPHPHIPPSLFCLLARSLALRRGEAASQGNPRNLCKKLTMKFKKFFDFGAIFEWIERFVIEGYRDFGLIRRTGRSRTIGKDRGRCGIFPTLSVILKETKHTKTPLVWTGCPELGFPVGPPEEVGFGEPGVPGSPETGLRLPPPPRALSQTPLRHGGRGRVGALPAAADPRAPGAPPPGCLGPVRLRAAAAAAAPPHPGRDPRTGKPESWLPAGPGPRRPAIPRPERRTGSRTRRLSAWGWGGTSRLTPCLSPAPFSPFLPPRDGSPRARRKPGSSQRPPSGRTTPAPAGSLQRDAAKEHYINTLGPDLDTEDSCFKKIQSSLKSCNLYAF
ncbi:uncharacterized protein LOC111164581 [Delphinapterus leucas]|uniref:Uncharacterized protein LOC111164581 n=1 Tax=Delphinapterus leucas TaxID=9749 RepID=A0A7F8KA69_DELLE|nr:uncharacterized protein LOC111164581 [Delphinapterus leucas]